MALLGLLPVPELPPGLRDQVLSLVKDDSAGRGRAARPARPAGRAVRPVRVPGAAGPAGRGARAGTFIPAAGVLVAVFAVFGGGAMLASNTLPKSGSPAVTALAPVAPSARPAPSASPPASGQARGGRQGGAQLRQARAGGVADRHAEPGHDRGQPGPSKSEQRADPSPASRRAERGPVPTPTPPTDRHRARRLRPTRRRRRRRPPAPTPTPTGSSTPAPTPARRADASTVPAVPVVRPAGSRPLRAGTTGSRSAAAGNTTGP